jgi:hypothetical protein
VGKGCSILFSFAAARKLRKGDGLPVDGGYDPLLEAEYKGEGAEAAWWKVQTFDGNYLEQLGFRPKSRVFRSVTPGDKEAVKNAVVALRRGTAQMPMKCRNLPYYLSHHILADRFNASESVYILSQVVADQQPSYNEEHVLLNEHDEEGNEQRHVAVVETGSEMEMTDFDCSDMSPGEIAIAKELMEMLNA